MPTAPLYYRPLVDAAIRSTPIGSTHVAAAIDRQVDFAFVAPAPGAERQIVPLTSAAAAAGNSALRPGIEASLTGLTALTDARRGAQLNGIKLSLDDEGYVANRALSVLDANPQLLDMDSPDQAAQRMAQLMQQVAGGRRDASIDGGVLGLPPALAGVLVKQWQGKEFVTGEEAAGISSSINRQIEVAVLTSQRGGGAAAGSTMSWIDEAGVDALALWPGKTSRMSQALGLTTDPLLVEKAASQLRAGAAAAPHMDALMRVLKLADVDVAMPELHDEAVSLLQGSAPHVALAERIIARKALPADKAGWLAGRLLDVGGRPGNVEGLEAEIARLVAPAPGASVPVPDPAPVAPAPVEPTVPSNTPSPDRSTAVEQPPIILPPG